MKKTDFHPTLPEPAWRQIFRRRLRAWYGRNARDLPWRRTRDPYAIWISEVMLQQTQVETVKPYYERFLTTFPDIASLAAADEQQVLRRWEGLGYYRRARQLHRAAQVIQQQHGGAFPSDVDLVLALPGVGRYTAGAVLSIAFDQRQPILEANTIRLLSRLLAFRGNPTSGPAKSLLWEMAAVLLPRKDCATINQALMELGSRVCTPRVPNCAACPVSDLCAARRLGIQDEVPARSRRTKFEEVRETAVVVRSGHQVLLRQRQHGERWAGLWDFPRFALKAQSGRAVRRELTDRVHDQTRAKIQIGRRLTTIRHGVTRFRITLDCYEAALAGSKRSKLASATQWVRIDQLPELPLSTTGRKISHLVRERTGEDG